MRHPDLRVLVEALEQRICGVDRLQIGTTILARVGLLNLTTQGVRNELSTIADAEYGHLADKLREIYLEGLGVVHRIGRTTEDDTNDVGIVVLGVLVVRQNLTEGVEFTDTTANELRGLRTEI